MTLNNLTVQNGKSSEHGGGLYAERGPITLNDCVLSNNQAPNGGGGAVYVEQTAITIHNSMFTENYAQFGGAIYTGWNAEITASTFTANVAETGGGGLAAGGNVVVVESGFFDNVVLSSGLFSGGGAIASDGLIQITNSAFTGNSANENGGAVRGSSVEVATSRFESNKADWGGAIEASGNVTISDSVFIQNHAQVGGGGVLVHYGFDDLMVRVTSSSFVKNTANGYDFGGGGGLSVWNGKLELTNSTFWGNQAGQEGGAVEVRDEATILNCTFFDNVGAFGGGLYGGDLSVGQSIIAGNQGSPYADIYTQKTFTSLGYNLIGSDNGGELKLLSTDLITSTPGLKIAEEGSYELVPSSPALNVIPTDQCATKTDQRGVSRPQTKWCDIRAIEMVVGQGFLAIYW